MSESSDFECKITLQIVGPSNARKFDRYDAAFLSDIHGASTELGCVNNV